MRQIVGLTLAGFVAVATPSLADEFSTSVMRPSPVTSGRVAGSLPGGDGSTSYYIAVDLEQGKLMTQLSLAGRANTDKKLTFELLDTDARVSASTYIMAGLDAKAEKTANFPIDSAGHYVIRVTVEGKETGSYCVLMGGPAMPNATATTCAVNAAAPPQVEIAPPAQTEAEVQPRNYEVIQSKCEERLRLGSDFLFDFDRAELRAEAAPTLSEIAARLEASRTMVTVEGHTDAKGTESYNQTLSERRAIAVRSSLTWRGLPAERFNIRGYGKSRPVAENVKQDGTDDPDGRQKNRRVEVVINTCG